MIRPPATAAVVEGTFVVSAAHASAVSALLAEYRAPCMDEPIRTLVLRRQIQSKGEPRPLPHPSRPHLVQTDASGAAMRAVLTLDQGSGLRPVFVASNSFTDAEQRYHTALPSTRWVCSVDHAAVNRTNESGW